MTPRSATVWIESATNVAVFDEQREAIALDETIGRNAATVTLQQLPQECAFLVSRPPEPRLEPEQDQAAMARNEVFRVLMREVRERDLSLADTKRLARHRGVSVNDERFLLHAGATLEPTGNRDQMVLDFAPRRAVANYSSVAFSRLRGMRVML